MFAIEARGIGEAVGARKIRAGWDLSPNETFTVAEYQPNMVLAPDGVSLVVDDSPRKEAVNKERDDRLQKFTHNGIEYDFNDSSRLSIQEHGMLALAALAETPQQGDLRWLDTDEDFTWIAADNTAVTMDAYQCFAFSKAAAKWHSEHIKAARTLKDMSPTPQDIDNNDYWPSTSSA